MMGWSGQERFKLVVSRVIRKMHGVVTFYYTPYALRDVVMVSGMSNNQWRHLW